jgi:hypothetical protein
MRWRKASAVLTATLALGGAYWGGCGDDDDDGAFFAGNVSSVTGGSTAAVGPSRPSVFARLGRPFVSIAHAQSTCEAPNGDLLFCVDERCTRVDDDCEFSRLVFVEGGGPLFVTLSFVDDANGDGSTDFDEAVSIVDEISICNGDQILVADAAVNFSGTTTASVVKTVDNCSGTSPTRTGTVGTATPTRTGTIGTGTPTSTPTGTVPTVTATSTGGATATPTAGTPTPTSTGSTMNDTPFPSFAFFASVAVIGLLLPRRRRRNNEDA